MARETYPKDFWRGIASGDAGCICDKHLLHGAFRFEKNEEREDGFWELSINWNDEKQSAELLLNRMKSENVYQFIGIARIELDFLRQSLMVYINRKEFSYERKAEEDNPYHGNLLVKGDLDKKVRTMISSTIAVIAERDVRFR